MSLIVLNKPMPSAQAEAASTNNEKIMFTRLLPSLIRIRLKSALRPETMKSDVVCQSDIYFSAIKTQCIRSGS